MFSVQTIEIFSIIRFNDSEIASGMGLLMASRTRLIALKIFTRSLKQIFWELSSRFAGRFRS